MKKLSAGMITALAACCWLPGALASAPVKEVGDRYRPGSLGVTQTDAAHIAGVAAPVAPAFPAGGATVNMAEPKHRAWLVKTADEYDSLDNTDSLDERVKRLEQQTDNMANMNLPQEISRLQQEVAELRGQLQQQQHANEQLNKQLTTFYQDLDSRLRQGGSTANTAAAATSSPAPATTQSSAVSVDVAEASTYQKAFSALAKRDYVAAKQGFTNYLTHFSEGKFVADAHYWLGEMYLQDKQYSAAEKEMDTVLKQYPNAGKVPDARLKLAIIHAAQGNVVQAKKELLEIKKQSPNSTAAQLANIRLQQLEQPAK